jgi:Mrp family chromosome partitioning ATPase
VAVQVIQYRKYPQAMTIRAKQMVQKVGKNFLGVVLNNINMSQDSDYYYYSGYYYDYYSKVDDDGDEEVSKTNGEVAATAETKSRIDLKQKY